MPGARVSGLGTYLPERVLTSDEVEHGLRQGGIAVAEGFIERVTGVRERRVAALRENASDLAACAAEVALAEAGVAAKDVELLIFASASHDVIEPATAGILQARLAAKQARTCDVKNACNSFVSGLDVASAYLRAGLAKVALVATGEIPSRAIRLSFDSQADLMARFAHLTMGDAGGAVVLTRAPDVGVGFVATGGVTRGELWKLGTILSGGTMFPRDLSLSRAYLQTRGRELEECGRAEIPPVAAAVLERVGWSPESINVVAMQQHTKKVVHEIVSLTGIPIERAPLPLLYAGNAVSGNVPLALADARASGVLSEGCRVMLFGGSSGLSILISALVW